MSDFVTSDGRRIPPGTGARLNGITKPPGISQLGLTPGKGRALQIGVEVLVWAKVMADGTVRILVRAPKRQRIAIVEQPPEAGPDVPSRGAVA
jgi:hypothetical protein